MKVVNFFLSRKNNSRNSQIDRTPLFFHGYEMDSASIPVDLLDPIFEPIRFLKQNRNQYDRGNRDGNDSIEDGKRYKVNQNLCFDGQFEPLYTKEGFE